jgi:hypothetical protein
VTGVTGRVAIVQYLRKVDGNKHSSIEEKVNLEGSGEELN